MILQPLGSSEVGHNSLAKRLYTVSELMQLTRMTRKQVTYWAKIGLVCPEKRDPTSPNGRSILLYRDVEVVKALVVCALRRAGLTPRQVQQVGRNLAGHGIKLSESEEYILTDGYSVYYAFSSEDVVDIFKHHGQMLLLVSLREQIAKLLEAA